MDFFFLSCPLVVRPQDKPVHCLKNPTEIAPWKPFDARWRDNPDPSTNIKVAWSIHRKPRGNGSLSRSRMKMPPSKGQQFFYQLFGVITCMEWMHRVCHLTSVWSRCPEWHASWCWTQETWGVRRRSRVHRRFNREIAGEDDGGYFILTCKPTLGFLRDFLNIGKRLSCADLFGPVDAAHFGRAR